MFTKVLNLFLVKNFKSTINHSRQKWKNEIQKRLANNVSMSIKKYQYVGGRGEVKAYEPWAFCEQN